MVRDHQGRILTRSNSGLMLWQADHWQEFNSENGVPEVSSLLVTREGEIWLGIFGHGLWQWLGLRANRVVERQSGRRRQSSMGPVPC